MGRNSCQECGARGLSTRLETAKLLQWRMPALTREKKITFGDMRASGVRGLLIYCSDYQCAHSVEISADRWPDHVQLSDLEPLFVCQACGERGADV
jgi:hypothetical protein